MTFGRVELDIPTGTMRHQCRYIFTTIATISVSNNINNTDRLELKLGFLKSKST